MTFVKEKLTPFRTIQLFFNISLFLIVSGCAMNTVVSESDRDTTGKYDGSWTVIVQGKGGKQYAGNSTLRCNPLKWDSILSVKNGEGVMMNLQYGVQLVPFNIDSNGKFVVKATSSAKWFNNQNIVIILKGELSASKSTGRYILSQEFFNGAGCRYKAMFTPMAS